MSWVAVAIGIGTTAAGAISANQQRQRAKGQIGKAYAAGRARLDLRQGDTRQSFAEDLTARGLANAGDVTVGRSVSPEGGSGGSPAIRLGGARTLGEQQSVDLRREQQLEQTAMRDEKDASVANVNAQTDQAMVNAGIQGISAGISAKGAAHELSAIGATGSPAISAAYGKGTMVDSPPPGAPSPYNGWGGIDPVHPLRRGTWSGTQGDFNLFHEVG